MYYVRSHVNNHCYYLLCVVSCEHCLLVCAICDHVNTEFLFAMCDNVNTDCYYVLCVVQFEQCL
jgi:hypothetical protein